MEEKATAFKGELIWHLVFLSLIIALDRKIDALDGVYSFQHSHYFRNIITFDFSIFAEMMFDIVLFSLWTLSQFAEKDCNPSEVWQKLINVSGYLKIIQGEHQVVFPIPSDFDLNVLFLE